jgi:hypothetical protein
MNGLNPATAAATRAPRHGEPPFDVLWNPIGDGLLPLQQKRLGWPLSCRRPQRILVETVPDLFDESHPDETLDLVHAVLAIAHWHRFLLATDRAERMIAYYSDAETPRRIAAEIGAFSFAILADDRREVPQDWIVGFSRVRYGLSSEYGDGIGPVGLESWPPPNLWISFCDGEERRIVPLPGLLKPPAGPAPDRAASV